MMHNKLIIQVETQKYTCCRTKLPYCNNFNFNFFLYFVKIINSFFHLYFLYNNIKYIKKKILDIINCFILITSIKINKICKKKKGKEKENSIKHKINKKYSEKFVNNFV